MVLCLDYRNHSWSNHCWIKLVENSSRFCYRVCFDPRADCLRANAIRLMVSARVLGIHLDNRLGYFLGLDSNLSINLRGLDGYTAQTKQNLFDSA